MAGMNLQDSILLSSPSFMKVHLIMCTRLRPLLSNLGTMTFVCMNYFYWHLDYDAQKPAFEKLPPNDAIYLQHKHESFSVCFLTG